MIGGGPAGFMAAITAAERGVRDVLILEATPEVLTKVRISGGGRCNFTNENASPENYICQNPHFIKSALSRYSAQDFIELIERHGVNYHHKTLGQLFCDDSAQDIVNVLMTECDWAGVEVKMRNEVVSVTKTAAGYQVNTNEANYTCTSLVVASGGLTMPKLG